MDLKLLTVLYGQILRSEFDGEVKRIQYLNNFEAGDSHILAELRDGATLQISMTVFYDKDKK